MENLEALSKEFKNLKMQDEILQKKIKAIKGQILSIIGEEDVETPYLKVSTNKGRKMVDYKKLVLDLGLDQDEEEMAKYIKCTKPIRVFKVLP